MKLTELVEQHLKDFGLQELEFHSLPSTNEIVDDFIPKISQIVICEMIDYMVEKLAEDITHNEISLPNDAQGFISDIECNIEIRIPYQAEYISLSRDKNMYSIKYSKKNIFLKNFEVQNGKRIVKNFVLSDNEPEIFSEFIKFYHTFKRAKKKLYSKR